HRHHPPPLSHKFSLAVADQGQIVGVLTAGRPVARMLDDGETLEVTRVCVVQAKNACSLLYAAARRIAKDMGFRKVITYTLASEPGTSLRPPAGRPSPRCLAALGVAKAGPGRTSIRRSRRFAGSADSAKEGAEHD